MKRREIKFVAGSLQLAPDRIEALPTLPKAPAGAPKRPKATRRTVRESIISRAERKSR
jgi:hypothetical protein